MFQNSKFCDQITTIVSQSHKDLLQRVANEYQLDFTELVAKFCEKKVDSGKQDTQLKKGRVQPAKKKEAKKKSSPKKKKATPQARNIGKCCARVWGDGMPQCTRKSRELSQDGKTCNRFCKTHFKFWLAGGDENLPHGVVSCDEEEKSKVVAVEQEKKTEVDLEEEIQNELQVEEKTIVPDEEVLKTPVKQEKKAVKTPPTPKKKRKEGILPIVEEKKVETPVHQNEDDEFEEEEVACKEFEYDGDVYLLDPASNKIYQRNGDNDFVGKLVNGAIDFDAEDSDAESDEEED